MENYGEIDVLQTVEELRSAQSDIRQQIPLLIKIGEVYLRRASTDDGTDFTKANALFNAARVRAIKVNDTESEEKSLRLIVKAYRQFMAAFASRKNEMSCEEVRREIDTHKKFLADERKAFQKNVEEIDACFERNHDNPAISQENYKQHAERMQQVFEGIQGMYVRLMSALVLECENHLGRPPCDYTVMALGSVARIEATPYSDLEFAILHAGSFEDIHYFRVLCYLLQMKVINLGETILPSLAIEELNNFQSKKPSDNWFYDSATPRGISFDGAMPWASKTPLGRLATENKPALELIKTPKEMAELQNETIAIKEGYHLADILSRCSFIYGSKALLEEYNERLAQKLNERSSLNENDKFVKTVGFERGSKQLMLDIDAFDPSLTYLHSRCTVGALFDTKKQFYRLPTLLVSNLAMIFDIRCPSPWYIAEELCTRGIIGVSEMNNLKICISIANEIRLKTYHANRGQKELLSTIPQYGHPDPSMSPPVFRYFNEEIVVRLLAASSELHRCCRKFSFKIKYENKVDVSLLKHEVPGKNEGATIGTLYYRMQSFEKALKWMKSVPTDSPSYAVALNGQGIIYSKCGDVGKSVECFESALQVHAQKEGISRLNAVSCLQNLAMALLRAGRYKASQLKMDEAIAKYNEIHGLDNPSITRCLLLLNVAIIQQNLGNMQSALLTLREVKTYHKIMKMEGVAIPDNDIVACNFAMADCLSELDKHSEAMEYVNKALKRSNKLFGEADLSAELAENFVNAGSIYEHCGKNDEALANYYRSLEILSKIFGDQPHPGKITCLNNIGNFYSRRYQTERAIPYLKRALDQARALYCDKPHETIALTLNNLGVALKKAEKFQESLPYFQEAKEIMNTILGTNHVHHTTSDILNNLGTIYQDLEQPKDALQCYKKVYAMNCEIYGEDYATDAMATVCSNIACVYEELDDIHKAKEFYTRAVDIDGKLSSTKNPSPGLVSSLYGLSRACESLGETQDSLRHLEKARDISKAANSRSIMEAVVLVELKKKYEQMGLHEQAKILLQEAKEVGKCLAKK